MVQVSAALLGWPPGMCLTLGAPTTRLCGPGYTRCQWQSAPCIMFGTELAGFCSGCHSGHSPWGSWRVGSRPSTEEFRSQGSDQLAAVVARELPACWFNEQCN
jgi:hypothetical protein